MPVDPVRHGAPTSVTCQMVANNLLGRTFNASAATPFFGLSDKTLRAETLVTNLPAIC